MIAKIEMDIWLWSSLWNEMCKCIECTQQTIIQTYVLAIVIDTI